MSSGSKAPFKRLYIAGHTGLVGSALMRRFSKRAGLELITAPRAQVDLLEASSVERFLLRERPDAMILAAGRVGGILANRRFPASFLYENLRMELNLIHGAWKAGVSRLLYFGSTCMYPREAPQPMRVDQLMTGRMEPTSEPYAVAKLAGMVLCQAYRRQYGVQFLTAIPATVYGPGDHFQPDDSHVLSALIAKLDEAKQEGRPEVTLWGSGAPRREFLYVDDLAEACELLLASEQSPDPIQIGSGETSSIRELADLVAQVVGYRGRIAWDRSQPDGAPEKRLDSGPMRVLGWAPRVRLREGIERTVHWYQQQSTIHPPAAPIPEVLS